MEVLHNNNDDDKHLLTVTALFGQQQQIRSFSEYMTEEPHGRPECRQRRSRTVRVWLAFIAVVSSPSHSHTSSASSECDAAAAAAVPDSPSLLHNASMSNVLSSQNADQPLGASCHSNKSATLQHHNELSIRVDKPEKLVGTMETYVMYRVSTSTNFRSDFLDAEYEVCRRYSDFSWLRQRLESSFPVALLPPLPEKHNIYSLDRFDAGFVRARCYMLHLFMSTLAQVPRIIRQPCLRAFITLGSKEWQSYRRNEAASSPARSAVDALVANRTALAGTIDARLFAQQLDLCQSLAQTLASFEKMSTRTSKTTALMCRDLASEKVVVEHWAQSLSTQPSERALAQLLTLTAHSLATSSNAHNLLADSHELLTQLPVRFAQHDADAAKNALRRRETYEVEEARARELLVRKQKEIQELSDYLADNPSAPASTRARWINKRDKLCEQVDEQKHAVAQRELELRDANHEMIGELNRWNGQRRQNTLDMLKHYALQRHKLHQQCADSWKATLDELTAAEARQSAAP